MLIESGKETRRSPCWWATAWAAHLPCPSRRRTPTPSAGVIAVDGLPVFPGTEMLDGDRGSHGGQQMHASRLRGRRPRSSRNTSALT